VIALLWNVVHLVRLHVLTLFLLMLKLIPLYPARQHSPGLQSTEEGTSLAATNMYKYLPQHTIVKIVFTRTCLACHFPTAEPGSRTSFVSLVDHAFHPAISSGPRNSISVLSAALSYSCSLLPDVAHALEHAVPQWHPV
jgi:hypothetical protein